MKKTNFIYKPAVTIDYARLTNDVISGRYIEKNIPKYILLEQSFEYRFLKKAFLNFIYFQIKLFVLATLRPRKEVAGNLDADEVERVYNKEAKTYNSKHHFTTRGMDTSWRRFAGYCVADISKNCETPISMLDICTGTGLTILEILNVLELYGAKANIVGLDYNQKMLNSARMAFAGLSDKINVNLVRGDATAMCGQKDNSDFEKFQFNSFDIITQVFGIGGIAEPLKVFVEVLKLLKNCGKYCLIDMHRPIFELPGEWPLFFKWIKMPLFEMVAYTKITTPLALNRLWAWRDTTALFYLIKLITIEENGLFYGYKTVSFEYEAQKWWFSLPVMPVAKMILEKEKISKEEEKNRRTLLNACSFR